MTIKYYFFLKFNFFSFIYKLMTDNTYCDKYPSVIIPIQIDLLNIEENANYNIIDLYKITHNNNYNDLKFIYDGVTLIKGKELGKGVSGDVYLYEGGQYNIAVKFFKHNTDSEITFLKESLPKTCGLIPTVLLDIGGKYISIMIRADGDLASLCKKMTNSSLSNLNILCIISQLIEYLTCLKQCNYLYSDIKPENILYKYIKNDTIQIFFGDLGGLCKINGESRAVATSEYLPITDIIRSKSYQCTEKYITHSLYTLIITLKTNKVVPYIFSNFIINKEKNPTPQLLAEEWILMDKGKRNTKLPLKSWMSIITNDDLKKYYDYFNKYLASDVYPKILVDNILENMEKFPANKLSNIVIGKEKIANLDWLGKEINSIICTILSEELPDYEYVRIPKDIDYMILIQDISEINRDKYTKSWNLKYNSSKKLKGGTFNFSVFKSVVFLQYSVLILSIILIILCIYLLVTYINENKDTSTFSEYDPPLKFF